MDETQVFEMLSREKPVWLARIQREATSAHAARRDPEDIFQDACLKAHKQWHAFSPSEMKFTTWFYRIVLDCIRDDHRRHTSKARNMRLEEIYPDQSSMQLLKGLVSRGTSPVSALARAERLQQVMELLTPEDGQVLRMRIFDEFTSEEIGQILGIPAGTVRQRYARARLRFGELWKQRYGAEGSKQ
jgi:RNA polymerase sigma-70 factor (ECF subfamily)